MQNVKNEVDIFANLKMTLINIKNKIEAWLNFCSLSVSLYLEKLSDSKNTAP